MVLSLFFFVDGMVDVLSVASVRRRSATATAIATYPRLWGSMARRTVDLDGFRRAGVAGVREDGGSSLVCVFNYLVHQGVFYKYAWLYCMSS